MYFSKATVLIGLAIFFWLLSSVECYSASEEIRCQVHPANGWSKTPSANDPSGDGHSITCYVPGNDFAFLLSGDINSSGYQANAKIHPQKLERPWRQGLLVNVNGNNGHITDYYICIAWEENSGQYSLNLYIRAPNSPHPGILIAKDVASAYQPDGSWHELKLSTNQTNAEILACYDGEVKIKYTSQHWVRKIFNGQYGLMAQSLSRSEIKAEYDDVKSDTFDPGSACALKGVRVGYYPGSLPVEYSTTAIDEMLTMDFDAIKIGYSGPYNNGQLNYMGYLGRLDYMVDHIAQAGKKTIVSITPRFFESDGVQDTLNNGDVLKSIWNQSPNYSILDIFDPVQVSKFTNYISLIIQRYKDNVNVIGFEWDWGYIGETGYFVGSIDGGTYAPFGGYNAGYSANAMTKFNLWRAEKGLPAVTELPQPVSGVTQQSADFVNFMKFRQEALTAFERSVFEQIRPLTSKPLGIFSYYNPIYYARNWVDADLADFRRSVVMVGVHRPRTAFLDSGIGPENVIAGDFQYHIDWFKMAYAREMAMGAGFWAFNYAPYPTGLYGQIANYLNTNHLTDAIRFEPVEVALFNPTYSAAVYPALSTSQKYFPSSATQVFNQWRALVESHGANYDLIDEKGLMDPFTLKRYKVVLVPNSQYLASSLGSAAVSMLAKCNNVVMVASGIPSRSAMRNMLDSKQVERWLDYSGETVSSGMVNNVVYNFTSESHVIHLLDRGKDTPSTLAPYEYRIVNTTRDEVDYNRCKWWSYE
jgi:hypothetical protein